MPKSRTISLVVRRDNVTGATCQLDGKSRVALLATWRLCHELLGQNDPTEWAQLITPVKLSELTEGAGVLKAMGMKGILHLENGQLHHAFAIVCLTSLQGPVRSATLRSYFACSLQVLAEACLLELNLRKLPAPCKLIAFGGWESSIQRIYRELFAQVSAERRGEITIGDALRLVLHIATANPGLLEPLLKELWQLTGSYRAALDHVLNPS